MLRFTLDKSENDLAVMTKERSTWENKLENAKKTKEEYLKEKGKQGEMETMKKEINRMNVSLNQRKCIFASATMKMLFRVLTNTRLYVKETNHQSKKLQLCFSAHAQPPSRYSAQSQRYFSHKKQDSCGRKSKKFVVGKNNAMLPT